MTANAARGPEDGGANVRLIAASLDLYVALTWAVEWMERYEGECMPEWREWAVRGRAALDAALPPSERPAGDVEA